MTNAASAEPAESRLWRAEHAGAAYDADIAACREAIGRGYGLHHLGHITHGILDFTVGTPDPPPGSVMTEALDSAGGQLSLAVVQLEEACEPLDSGPLIRMVLQGENGALLHVLKVAGQSFFGLTFDGAPETVDRADRELARLAERAARRIGGETLRWGGFRDREDSGELLVPYEARQAPRSGTSPSVSAAVADGIPDSAADACRAALHQDNLHYVGIYQRDLPAWSADIFDGPELEPFFQRVTRSSRRRGYALVIRQVTLEARRFRNLLALVHSGHLVRLVLDVARGAIYVLPLSDDDYLVAVTLIQSRVEEADRKARELHEALRAWWPAGSRPLPHRGPELGSLD